MKIGVPKEIKPQENRIGLTPASVKTLVAEGHEVLVENNGGFEAGFENANSAGPNQLSAGCCCCCCCCWYLKIESINVV